MKRFFCPKENIIADAITIDDKEEIRHIVSVMRSRVGESVNVFDGQDCEYYGVITKITKNTVTISIDRKDKSFSKKVYVTLACAIPKKSKFDQIVERCTELGVDKIIPIITKRTIVNLDARRRSAKLERWRRIAVSACKQCGRNTLIEIEGVKDFSDCLQDLKDYDAALILCLAGKRKSLKDALRNFKGKRIIVFIGPEGDFTDDEIAQAKQAGCHLSGLGETVLRVETAALFVASVLKYTFESH
ncbi:16S rRNA (uracil(1498)-N(3))-methyltransferase [Candidatus Omnitrophota bacterium]